jgi:predicted RNase H-like HicB family nuclease
MTKYMSMPAGKALDKLAEEHGIRYEKSGGWGWNKDLGMVPAITAIAAIEILYDVGYQLFLHREGKRWCVAYDDTEGEESWAWGETPEESIERAMIALDLVCTEVSDE